MFFVICKKDVNNWSNKDRCFFFQKNIKYQGVKLMVTQALFGKFSFGKLLEKHASRFSLTSFKNFLPHFPLFSHLFLRDSLVILYSLHFSIVIFLSNGKLVKRRLDRGHSFNLLPLIEFWGHIIDGYNTCEIKIFKI